MKKYLDRRWVSNSLSLDTPPSKKFRKQENWVTENICGGKLFVPLDIGQDSVKGHSSWLKRTDKPRGEALALLALGEDNNSGDFYEEKSDESSVSDEYDLLTYANDFPYRSYDIERVVLAGSTYPISGSTRKNEWECDSVLVVCDIGVQTE